MAPIALSAFSTLDRYNRKWRQFFRELAVALMRLANC
jgi:hypothetical protein